MSKKQKTVGQLLAELRWSKTTEEQRKAHGRKLTDARLAKRAKLNTVLEAVQELENLPSS